MQNQDNALEQRQASDYSDLQFNIQSSVPQPIAEMVAEAENTLPTQPKVEESVSSSDELLYTLRHFHLGDPSAVEPVSDDYVPALLHAYRDTSKMRYAYPLLLTADETQPISKFLLQQVEQFAPTTDAARILKDNLPRLERILRHTLKEQEGVLAALPILSEAGKTLETSLELDAENNTRLQADFEKLLATIPSTALILGYGRYSAIHLLNYAIRNRLIPRRTAFHAKIDYCIEHLNVLLAVENTKSDESIEPKKARDSVGFASSRFNPDALSDVMAHSTGSVIMDDRRRQRILENLLILEEYQQNADDILIKLVHLDEITGTSLENIPDLEDVIDPNPCAKATLMFDEQATKLAKVFAATRIAQFEIDDTYDVAIHDPWFAHFTWEAFSKEEILLLPAVIALESADRIANSGMPAISRLLSSGRPVHILVGVQAYNNPHATAVEESFLNYRLELGYFGMSHRQALVSQSSAARHQHLLKQFLTALETTRTSLHILNTGLQYNNQALTPWLMAGAALESRAHPFFCFNPEAGDASADSIDFSNNPQPEVDWPSHPFRYQDDQGKIINTDLAFTFADYALLVTGIHHHFRVVPAGIESDDLIPVETYLATAQKGMSGKQIPFIWAVNSEGALHKLVVSRALIVASWDRLNYWHTLQEMAGINNKHVNLALQNARKDIQAEEQVARVRLEAEYAENLEQVRQDTAGEVMQRLTNVLLGTDLSAAAIRKPVRSAPVAPAVTEESSVIAEKVAEPVVEEESFDDPWIDSELCTTCNDCLGINTVLFVYNENKQAIIGEMNSGTYAQLVEGAEICPADCIHPGKPKNPDEPGLAELIERAKAYN